MFNYRNFPSLLRCLLAHRILGGPINKVDFCKQEILDGIDGFIVNTDLVGSLKNNSYDYHIYESCTGSGSDLNPVRALEKSISESLERWAFLDTASSKDCAIFCFDLDPSTTGMAAHPNYNQARDNSFYEALERWAIHTWWKVGLPYQSMNEKGILIILMDFSSKVTELKNFNIPNAFVTITHKKEYGFHTYGFGAGPSKEQSLQKAEIERIRNRDALKWFKNNGDKSQKLNTTEEALLFYSRHEGYILFQNILERNKTAKLSEFEVILSKEILGPWTKWVTVYRTLLNTKFSSIRSAKQPRVDYTFPF